MSMKNSRKHLAARVGVIMVGSLALGGCKATWAKLNAFKAETQDSWEYLIERTIGFDGAASDSMFSNSYATSTPNALGNLSAFDSTMPGSGAAFAQSLDSIGLCYWYAKVPKVGPIDGGFSLDYPDGTPNLGVRNNLIARAGVPLTNNIVSVTDVLQAMHDAGGELRRMQEDIQKASVRLNDVLMSGLMTSGALGAAGAGGAAATGALYQQLGPQRISSAARSFSAGLATLQAGGAGAETVRSAAAVNVSGLRASRQYRVVNGVTEAVTTYALPNTGKGRSFVQIVTNAQGQWKWRATSPNGSLRDLNKAKFLAGGPGALKTLGFANEQEITKMTKNLVQRTRLATVVGANKLAGAGKSALKGTVNFGIQTCKGSPLAKSACVAAVGLMTATAFAAPKVMGANAAAKNDAEIAKTVQSVLNNPKIAEEIATIMKQLEKETIISPELMEALRKQLIAKSAASTRGNCNQTFGTEILTTSGVADSGYDLDASGSFSSPKMGYIPSSMAARDANTALPSLPVTPSDALSDMPQDASDPLSGSLEGPLDLGTSTSDFASSIPADQLDSSSSGTDLSLDSSLDSFGSGDATSL